MSVNYRELLKDYIKYIEESEGVTCLEWGSETQWGKEEWEAMKEILDELDFWYNKSGK